MNRKVNIISNVILFAVTIATIVVSILLIRTYNSADTFLMVVLFIAGAVIAAFLCTVFHELGHVFAAKKNGFQVTHVKIWFFLWTIRGKRKTFDFVLPGGEAGATETVPQTPENMPKRLKKLTLGGIYGSGVMLLLGAVFASLYMFLPLTAYCILTAFLPVSAYFFFDSALPMINGGLLNDGGVLYGLRKKTDSLAVQCSVLRIQAEMFGGKTPAEVDQTLYFSVPQLPEDDVNFYHLLNARYNYYLDKEDYENAKKVITRLYGLTEDMPTYIKNVVMTDALYSTCTFDFNEDRADAIMYELDKYLNSINDAQSLRAKLAYLLYVKKETEYAEEFIERGLKEAGKCVIKGQGLFEKKLFDKLENDLKTVTENPEKQ